MSAPRPIVTVTQPTSSTALMTHLRQQQRDIAFSTSAGVSPPPTRLAPSVASALTGPPPRR
eukprot:10337443-Karenia_brevis.AAC.1